MANKRINNTITKDQKILWNDRRIVDAFKNQYSILIRHFRAHGLEPPSQQAFYQFVSRERIPDRWRPTLLYLAMRERGMDVTEMFIRAKEEEDVQQN